MRLFISSLGQQRLDGLLTFTEPVLKLTGGVNVTADSFFWFTPYLASDWPEITGVTKKYFFIYSTDHSYWGGMWGEGDELDLSDFVEKGRIFTTNASPESLCLYRVPSSVTGDDEEIHLSYHPSTAPQSTKLYTSSGGSLYNIGGSNGESPNANWTYRGTILPVLLAVDNPLGYNENHTGYAKMWKIGSGWQARHTTVGGDAQTVRRAISTSPDGKTFTRWEELPSTLATSPLDYECTLNSVIYFERNGITYFIGQLWSYDDDGGGGDSLATKSFYLGTCDANYNNWEFLYEIGQLTRNFGMFIEGNTLHVYNAYPDKYHLSYQTGDLSVL